MTLATGGCLCGEIRYEVDGPLRGVIACHCAPCRKSTGNFVTATACWRSDFSLAKSESLRWYVTEAKYRRGFCANCGSTLFFDQLDGDRISITAGSFDEPQGLRTLAHINVAEAGEYYTIDDSVPISFDGMNNVAMPPQNRPN
jgi:hypothetical protein